MGEGLILVVWTFDKGSKRDMVVVFCLYISKNWLVVWTMNFIFLNRNWMMIQSDELHHFSGG